MNGDSMGLFDGVDLTQSELFENSKYFQEGRYILQIVECKGRTSEHKGTSLIIEATVLATTATSPDGPKVGERGAHVWSISGEKRKMGIGTMMAFLCASLQAEQTAHDDATWKQTAGTVFGGNNALVGRVYGLDCHMKKTKKNTDFTVHSWRGPQTPAQLAEFGLNPDGTVMGAG